MYRTLLLLLALAASSAFAGAPQIGDKAPTRLGLSRYGDSLETTQYAGKVLVVTFWASWCAPCRAEMPMLEGLQRVVGKNKLEVVSLNIETRDSTSSRFARSPRRRSPSRTTRTSPRKASMA